MSHAELLQTSGGNTKRFMTMSQLARVLWSIGPCASAGWRFPASILATF